MREKYGYITGLIAGSNEFELTSTNVFSSHFFSPLVCIYRIKMTSEHYLEDIRRQQTLPKRYLIPFNTMSCRRRL